VSDAGLKIAAHFYNRSNQWRGDDGVLFAKVLDADQVSCLVHNIERGRSHVIEPRPWQTDTCIGDWHYDENLRENHGYKSSLTVVHALIDIVSKNGNLLLNLPLRGDGTLDAEALAVVEGIAAWMQINQEAIHGTRPWRIFGEGPQMAAPATAPGDEKFNETKIKPLGAEDIRFTTKGSTLYAIVMGAPKGAVSVKSLGTAANLYDGAIGRITLVGSDEKLTWSQSAEGLTIDAPKSVPNGIAVVFKIAPRS
jgi:alpha-L-fucosidase